MVELYETVAEESMGWLTHAEGTALREAALLAAEVSNGIPFLEIGGYAGKSACWIGSAAAETNRVLFSIDWHRGSPEMAPDRECHHPEMVGKDGVFDTLPHFRANLRRAELEQSVIPVAGSSHVVASYWSTPVSLLFIDGDHEPAGVMADYVNYNKHIIPGGFLAFHDWPVISGIAAERALSEGFAPYKTQDCLHILRKI